MPAASGAPGNHTSAYGEIHERMLVYAGVWHFRRAVHKKLDTTMANTWWDLGEWSGYPGSQLALYQITCPFCMERGNFEVEHHATKKKPNGPKVLNFDTLKCGNCAGYVMVLWSVSSDHSDHHDYRVLPWPPKLVTFPKHWPEQVGRYWLQAHRNLNDQNWDASSVMARSALQIALREHKAVGANLKQEIEGLASRGVLPPLMTEHITSMNSEMNPPILNLAKLRLRPKIHETSSTS